MVSYCCVKGCNNNGNNKKNPNVMTSFHAFPSNKEMRQKWLIAIGRPDWRPTSGYSRVCSAHFSREQIYHDGQRMRIKDDAVPAKKLPANSNFEASAMEVCRFCLAVEVKLYSLQDGVHRVYLESLAGQIEMAGLPQLICYECAAYLKKCYDLWQKSLTAQATLLDIFAEHGKITTNLIKTKNRQELNLLSPLAMQDIVVEDNLNNTEYISIRKEDTNFEIKPENIQNTEQSEVDSNTNEDKELEMIEETDWLDEEFLNSADSNDAKPEYENKGDEESKQEEVEELVELNLEGVTPDEVDLQKYFKVVQLTLYQQIQEWTKTKEKGQLTGKSFTCEICSKVFAHETRYRLHAQSHDPSRGSAECGVCKRRFPSAALARSHARRVHSNKFCCKQCPKIYYSSMLARKHLAWHAGRLYRCGTCGRGFTHVTSRNRHIRSAHAGVPCARCGEVLVSARGLLMHQFKHPECAVRGSEETASRATKPGTGANRNPKNRCNKCDVEFPSREQLVEHRRAEHKQRRKHNWPVPDDEFPAQCEHCSVVVNSRAEHYAHVRRAHPAQRGSYRPFVTVVCAVCGKGYQNSTRLRIHELRHGAPKLQCPECPRLLHDRYALARHAATHAPDRPYRCARCGLGFKQRSNMIRHSRVHADLTPYECALCGNKFKYSSSRNLHVRTVHQRQPLPPRRRKRGEGNSGENNSGKGNSGKSNSGKSNSGKNNSGKSNSGKRKSGKNKRLDDSDTSSEN